MSVALRWSCAACGSDDWLVVPCGAVPVWSAHAGGHRTTALSGRSSRCSGRALRDEIGAILARDFVLSVIPISTAHR